MPKKNVVHRTYTVSPEIDRGMEKDRARHGMGRSAYITFLFKWKKHIEKYYENEQRHHLAFLAQGSKRKI